MTAIAAHSLHNASLRGLLYALSGDLRPSVTETLEIAQRVRQYLMGIHARMAGGPLAVSWKFSGKDRVGVPLAGHRHAFILPMDLDQDGRLDHLVVHCREPFDDTERAALSQLERVWLGDDDAEIRFTLVNGAVANGLFSAARVLTSTTPFVPPRHYRKGRGDFNEWLGAEVRREAGYHGLPAPVSVTPVPRLVCRGHSFHWLDFRRNRKGDRIEIGYGFQLKFPEPVAGPVALGYGCHFGLGQFAAAE